MLQIFNIFERLAWLMLIKMVVEVNNVKTKMARQKSWRGLRRGGYEEVIASGSGSGSVECGF